MSHDAHACWFCLERGCAVRDGVRHCPCPGHFGGQMPPKPRPAEVSDVFLGAADGC